MAGAELSAELKLRDGQRQRLSVPVDKGLMSLMSGLKELNTNVSRLLTHVVEQEKTRGSGTPGEEEEEEDTDEEDTDEESDEEEPSNGDLQCPAKRLRNA